MIAKNTTHPLVLLPGYWLGSWAWDAVADRLRVAGHAVSAVTFPGLESPFTPRAEVTFADHVAAALDALDGERAVLVAHSGAGAVATAVLDRAPERVARVVYVDSGPSADGTVPRPDVGEDVVELPLPSFDELEAEGSSLAGLDEAALRRFRDNAVPHPAGAVRERLDLHDPRRHAVPATLVCCSMTSALVRELAAAAQPMLAAVNELEHVDYVDLLTGHWPMWSRPAELAEVIGGAAVKADPH